VANSHSERLVHLDGATGLQHRASVGFRCRFIERSSVDDRVTAQLRRSAIAGPAIADCRARAERIPHIDHRLAKRAEPGSPCLHLLFLRFWGLGHLPAGVQVQEFRYRLLLWCWSANPLLADADWRHRYHVQTAAKSTTMQDNRAVPSDLRLSDLPTAVRAEYRRIFTERRDDLLAVSFNAVLVTICWFLLPAGIQDWLFTLHGALAFPYFLEMWMLADAPATNVAGRDSVRALPQLQDPTALRLWLRAKHIVLWSFVGPVCALVTVVIGIVQHRYAAGAAVAITLLFLPLAVLSVAAWVGLWLPYHPQKLLWRWQHAPTGAPRCFAGPFLYSFHSSWCR
jgi:hypothetical protein